jgi:hypothetical protein
LLSVRGSFGFHEDRRRDLPGILENETISTLAMPAAVSTSSSAMFFNDLS